MKTLLKPFTIFFNWLFDDSNKNRYLLDDKIFFSSICLAVIGIIMVYSSSIAYASHDPHIQNQYYYINHHIVYLTLGIIAGSVAFSLPSTFWKKNAVRIAIVVVVLLIAVLIPHVGRVVNGSRRWIGFGPINIQPSELAKLSMVIFLSYYITRNKNGLKRFFHDVLPVLLIIGFVAALLLAEPDMGSTMVVFVVALVILIVANINIWVVLSMVIIGSVGTVSLIIAAPYRMRRFLGFIHPWEDALGKGYQLTHSLLAVGHGSWFGVGIGNSIEKLLYLPEAHTDFIMAIIGEETGVVGISIVLFLFWIIFYRGFNIVGYQCREIEGRQFQGLLAQGISVWFMFQALVNIGVAVGVLPTKGLTLPFISFGGSSILVSCIAIAILLKIDYENKIIQRDGQDDDGVWH